MLKTRKGTIATQAAPTTQQQQQLYSSLIFVISKVKIINFTLHIRFKLTQCYCDRVSSSWRHSNVIKTSPPSHPPLPHPPPVLARHEIFAESFSIHQILWSNIYLVQINKLPHLPKSWKFPIDESVFSILLLIYIHRLLFLWNSETHKRVIGTVSCRKKKTKTKKENKKKKSKRHKSGSYLESAKIIHNIFKLKGQTLIFL